MGVHNRQIRFTHLGKASLPRLTPVAPIAHVNSTLSTHRHDCYNLCIILNKNTPQDWRVLANIRSTNSRSAHHVQQMLGPSAHQPCTATTQCTTYSGGARVREASRRRPGMAWLLTSGSGSCPPSLMVQSLGLHGASSPPPTASPAVGTLRPLPEGLLVVLVQLLSSADVQPLLGRDEPSRTRARGGSCRRRVESSGRGVLAAPQCSPSAPVDTLCLRPGGTAGVVRDPSANPDAEVAQARAWCAWVPGMLPSMLAVVYCEPVEPGTSSEWCGSVLRRGAE